MYRIFFTSAAEKEYKYLQYTNKSIFTRVRAALCSIAEDPLQGKPLKFSLKTQWSYRVGSYRIIYTIEHNILMIRVLDIGHRREVYR